LGLRGLHSHPRGYALGRPRRAEVRKPEPVAGAPMSDADRQRLRQWRIKNRKLVLTVEVDGDETVEMLIAARLLPDADFYDRQTIARALSTYLSISAHV
jgi:hypothetical protein